MTPTDEAPGPDMSGAKQARRDYQDFAADTRPPDEARGPDLYCTVDCDACRDYAREHRVTLYAALPAPVAGADEDGPPLQEPPPNRECETCGQPVFCGHCYEEDGIAYEERKWEQR